MLGTLDRFQDGSYVNDQGSLRMKPSSVRVRIMQTGVPCHHWHINIDIASFTAALATRALTSRVDEVLDGKAECVIEKEVRLGSLRWMKLVQRRWKMAA